MAVKKRTIEIVLIRHFKDDQWFQRVVHCTFYSHGMYDYDLSRAEISKDEANAMLNELKMKTYINTTDLEFYGTPNICKIHKHQREAANKIKLVIK